MNEELHDLQRQSEAIDAIGEIFLTKNKPDTALQYFKQSLEIRSHINTSKEIAHSYLNIARAYNKQEKYLLAEKAAHKSLQIGKETGVLKEILYSTKLLHSIYHKTGNDPLALKYLMVHKNYSDSVFNEAKIQEFSKIQSRHEIDEITQENELLTKESELKETQLHQSKTQLRKQQVIVTLSLVAIIIAIIFTYTTYRLYVSKNKIHRLLKQLNHEIIDQRDEIKTQARLLAASNEKINAINESLEDTIQERTKEILRQNTKIKEYAFSNTHKIRTPVMRLRAYVDTNIKKDVDMENLHNTNKVILDEAFVLEKVTNELAEFLNKNIVT